MIAGLAAHVLLRALSTGIVGILPRATVLPMTGRVAAAVIFVLLCAPSARADDFSELYKDYRKDGQIEACDYSEDELRDAEGEVPPDIEQYAPSFVDELAAAREKRSRGDCEPKEEKPAEQAAPPAGAAPPAQPPTSDERTSEQANKPAQALAPAPAPEAQMRPIVAGVASPKVDPAAASGENAVDADALLPWAGLGLLVMALAGALAWLLGWSPGRRLRPLRASVEDAGGRGADWAAEFWDWLRLGR